MPIIMAIMATVTILTRAVVVVFDLVLVVNRTIANLLVVVGTNVSYKLTHPT